MSIGFAIFLFLVFVEMMMKGKEYVSRDAFAHAMLRTTLSLTMDDIQYIQDMFRSDDGDSVRSLIIIILFHTYYHSDTTNSNRYVYVHF